MDTLTRLKNVSLFASLSPDNLSRLAALVTRRSYPKGSILCRQDEFGDTLYVIDSGEVILHQTDLRGLQRPSGYLREGDHFGADALFLGDAYNSCAQAITDVKVLCIRKQDFDRLLEEHPQIKKQLNIPRLIRERLRAPTFPWLDKDEPALLLRKRHWFVFARNLPIPLLTLLFLVLVHWLLRQLNVELGLLSTLFLLGTMPSALALGFFKDWQDDFYLVTAKRVLHREKVFLIYETWDEAPLAKIQNINITRGFTARMLGFGKMQIQTASARGMMVLDHLPDPEGMQEVIFKRVGQLRARTQQAEREEIRQELVRQMGREKVEDAPITPPSAPPEQPKKKPDLLASLLTVPNWLKLRYEEDGQITWRKHWIFLIRRIYLALPAVLLTAALIVLSILYWPASYTLPLFLASLVLWTAAVCWLWWEVTDWGNDVYIVTDRMIIDVERKPLFFAEEKRQATLDMIQNISLRMPGPLAAILNYGDVLIQTAGPEGAFTFDGVHNPTEVQREVFRRAEAYGEAQRRREREQRKAEFSAWFQVYDEISRQKGSSG